MKAVILAGGRGTRLGELAREIPKAMVRIGNYPILEHQINLLKRYAIKDIILITGYLSEAIENYFKDGSKFGVSIAYYQEIKPLGTTGGLKEVEHLLTEDFIILYGDIMINMDLKKLVDFHFIKKSDCTLVLHPNNHPYDSDLVEMSEDGKIVAFHSKPHAPQVYYKNLVNAGLYVMSSKVLSYIEQGVPADFGRDVFPRLLHTITLYGYNTAEYLKDVGTVERLEEVTKDLLSGKIDKLNSEHKRNAIFLDRDGVINKDVGLLYKVENFTLLPETGKAIKMINDSEYLAIVITNQPVVARNLCSIDTVEEIHKKMETLLGTEHAKLDAIYYCPHHPDKGYPGENPLYKIDCTCRKPKTGLIDMAVQVFNINVQDSFFIGDSWRDILCGSNAGMTTIGVRTGEGCRNRNVIPDYFFENFHEAVQFILRDPYRSIFDNINKKFQSATKQNPFILTIGGNSRSGKTVLARYIAKKFEKQGANVLLLSLDNWLVSNSDRGPINDLFDRFQINKINEDILRLLKSEVIEQKKYDPYSRTTTEEKVQVSFYDKDIIVIEGVIALSSKTLRDIASLKIFCEISELLLRERISNYYFWKDLPEHEIEQLFTHRKKDEYDIIKKDRIYADIRISADEVKQ